MMIGINNPYLINIIINPFLSSEYVFTLLQAKLDHFFITELITGAITWEFCSTKVDKNIPTKH